MRSDYSKIESGKRYYTFEQCKRIALALNTSMDYLAGLTNDIVSYRGKDLSDEQFILLAEIINSPIEGVNL